MKHISLFLVTVIVISKTHADIKIVGDLKNLIPGKGFQTSTFDESSVEPLKTVIEKKSGGLRTSRVGSGKEHENDCCQKCEDKFGKDIKLLYNLSRRWTGTYCYCYSLKDGVTTVKPSKSSSTYTGACGDLVIDGLGEKTTLSKNSDVEALLYSYTIDRYYVETTRAEPGEDKCCQKCQETFAEELNGVLPVYSFYGTECYCGKPKSQNITLLTQISTLNYAGFCDAGTRVVEDCAEHAVYRFDDNFKIPTTTERSWSKCGENCQIKTTWSWFECGEECQKLGEASCKTWVFLEGRKSSTLSDECFFYPCSTTKYSRVRCEMGKCVAYSKKAEDLKQLSEQNQPQYSDYRAFTSGNNTCP